MCIRDRPWNVLLPVAQLKELSAFRLAWRHCESPVERAARGNHTQVRVEHEKGLTYGIYDGLSQLMPMRDGAERIAFGHPTGLRFICSIYKWDSIKPRAQPNLAITTAVAYA